MSLSAAALSWLLILVIYMLESGWSYVPRGVWIAKFLTMFCLCGQTVKLYFMVTLETSATNRTYFFYLYLVQYAVLALLALIALLYHPSKFLSRRRTGPDGLFEELLSTSEGRDLVSDPSWDRSSDTASGGVGPDGTNTLYVQLAGGEKGAGGEGQGQDAVNPESKASCWSIITFSWLNPIITLGYKRPLEEEDLWKLSKGDQAEELTRRFNVHWDKELARSTERRSTRAHGEAAGAGAEGAGEAAAQPSLLRALRRTFGCRFALGGFIKLFNDASQFVGPVFLGQFIHFVSDPTVRARERDKETERQRDTSREIERQRDRAIKR